MPGNQSVEGDNYSGSDYVPKVPPFDSENQVDVDVITSQPKRSDVEIVFGINNDDAFTGPPKYESLSSKHYENSGK